jgi:hypothetical protein
MLPLILLAGGAYLIGKAVLEDDKYAEGGVMAKGGEVVNEYKLVFKNDKGDYLSHYTEGVSIGDAYKVGKWREENTYGREGYKFIPSMTKLVANDIVSGTFEVGSDWMEDKFDEARPFKINRKMSKGGKVKQKFEYVNWEDISDDPKDNNKGFIYGINLIDEESGEVVDVEWFKTESLRDKAIKKYDLEEYEFESEMAKGGNVEGKSGSKFKIEMWNSFDDMAYEKKKPSRIVYSDSEDELRELGEDNRSSKLYMKRKGKYMNITTFLEKGGEVKDYSGNYYSTYDFVAVNKLEKEADSLFGKDWEAEDDASQILELTDSLGGGYTTYVSEDDEDWQRLRYKHSLNNETNDSNYDIFVVHYGRKKKK